LKQKFYFFSNFKRPICSKLNAYSEYVIKNGLFCYLAAHFIDLLEMQICKNMHLHKIVNPVNNLMGLIKTQALIHQIFEQYASIAL